MTDTENKGAATLYWVGVACIAGGTFVIGGAGGALVAVGLSVIVFVIIRTA